MIIVVYVHDLNPLTTNCAFLCSSSTCAVCCWIMSSSCCRNICCWDRSWSWAACCKELPGGYTPDHTGPPRSSTSPPARALKRAEGEKHGQQNGAHHAPKTRQTDSTCITVVWEMLCGDDYQLSSLWVSGKLVGRRHGAWQRW